MIEPRDPKVIELIQRIDALLQTSGVKALCISCWQGKLKKETGGVGCCNGCLLLAPDGCMDKPLSCALWLCEYARQQFPEVAAILSRTKWGFAGYIAQAHRGESIEIERRNLAQGQDNLVQIEAQWCKPGGLL